MGEGQGNGQKATRTLFLKKITARHINTNKDFTSSRPIDAQKQLSRGERSRPCMASTPVVAERHMCSIVYLELLNVRKKKKHTGASTLQTHLPPAEQQLIEICRETTQITRTSKDFHSNLRADSYPRTYYASKQRDIGPTSSCLFPRVLLTLGLAAPRSACES